MISSVKRIVVMAMFTCIATGIFAEEAPVFDADNFPPQFDGQPDSSTAQSAPKDQPQSLANPTAVTESQPLSMDQRVSRLEAQINSLLGTDLSAKVSDIQGELQALRGQVEELTHQLQQLQTQQKAQYSDLDKRLSHSTSVTALNNDNTDANTPKSVNKTKSKISSGVAVNADSQPNVAEEQQIYQTAYRLIKAKKYDAAAATLQKMLQKYPSGQFAANAHYWLGELYGLMGKNDQALTEFNTVVQNYPDSPKLADSQLKLGLIYAAQFKWPDAKKSFKKVINNYPGTSWARLASEQLRQIKQSGH